MICSLLSSGAKHLPLALALLLPVALAPAQVNVFANPAHVVDGNLTIETADALLRGATQQNLQPTADGTGLALSAGVAAGELRTGDLPAAFPFNEGIPYWNVAVPPGGGLTVLMQVRAAGQPAQWSDWFIAGAWGTANAERFPRTVPLGAFGTYAVDSLQLAQLCDQVRFIVRITRGSQAKASAPIIRLLGLNYTNSTGDARLAASAGAAAGGAPAKRGLFGGARGAARSGGPGQTPRYRGKTVAARVPFSSQVIARSEWVGRICSPASVAMAVRFFGSGLSTQQIASAIYDPGCDAFGVWHRAVQAGAQAGVRGTIVRMRNWEQVAAALRAGSAVCASIRFELNEVSDPPLPYKNKRGTKGHLIVITAVNADGTVTVNDSASKDVGAGARWSQDDLARAWFDKGGVSYLFTGGPSRPRR